MIFSPISVIYPWYNIQFVHICWPQCFYHDYCLLRTCQLPSGKLSWTCY